jgi:hypothetical protein
VVGCTAGKEAVHADKSRWTDSRELTERKEQRNVYKVVFSYEIMPGKLDEYVAWCKQTDEQRKQQNPAYEPFRRFVTCFGSANQVVAEWTVEDPASATALWQMFEAKGAGPSERDSRGDLYSIVVPGSSKLRLLKEVDLDS